MMGDATRGEGAAAEPSRRAEEPLRRQVSILGAVCECAKLRKCLLRSGPLFAEFRDSPAITARVVGKAHASGELWGKRMQATERGKGGDGIL